MNLLQVSKQLSLLSKAWKRGSKPEVAIVLFKPFFLVLKEYTINEVS